MNTQEIVGVPKNSDATNMGNSPMYVEAIGSLILVAGAAAVYIQGFFRRANDKADSELEATKKLLEYQEDRITELEIENRQLRQAMELSGVKAPSVTQERILEIKQSLGAANL